MKKNDTQAEPIAIIGMGGIFPRAANIPAFWANILAKTDSIIEVPKDRWDWSLYYDPDPAAPDKTYSKIGGFVRDIPFDPLKLRIPPNVADQMDTVQKMAVTATAEALKDSGYDRRPHDPERAAVILGNAMGGPKKEATDLRVYTAYIGSRLALSPEFAKLPESSRQVVMAELAHGVKSQLSTITEDTMPGELSNVIAGRVANVFNFNGANFTVDAACASSLAALDQAVNGLRAGEYDMVFSGGVDQMMSPPSYVKFCKIGALSPDGSRPFDAEANGFVMGEGAGVVVLKRLSDALKDGDRIYALVRAVGSSSDGRGKGITAPNPKGQRLAMERAFAQLDYTPGEVGLLEAHGTATKVGDLVEVNAGAEIFKPYCGKATVGLGSIKSQIGHLKAAAGVASLIKTALALHHKTLPPTINFKTPNPGVDWPSCPFFVVTEPREWDGRGRPRRANLSSFGFGGTNFHVALEEADAAAIGRWERAASAARAPMAPTAPPPPEERASEIEAGELPPSILNLAPALGGEAFMLDGDTPEEAMGRLRALQPRLTGEQAPLGPLAHETNARAKRGEFRIAFAGEPGPKLKEKIESVLRFDKPGLWDVPPPQFKTRGVFLGKGAASGKIGMLFPGQGSQYVDMVKDLRAKYQVVADTFDEADAIMEPLIGRKLTELLFTKGGETPERLAAMEDGIKQTEVTQPAVLTADVAILRLLESYGVRPDMVCGHSLGEYGALVAAGVLSFRDALLAVSARAKEMAGVQVPDCGKMASVAAPLEKVEAVLKEVPGYVAVANKNCPSQTVIAGETAAVEDAVRRFTEAGVQAVFIRVSHAFHSKIVAPAQDSYSGFLDAIQVSPPRIPVLSNVTAEYYPEDVRDIRKLMVRQIASPVEFIRQIERMYQDGARLFIEVGPKRVLTAFVTSILEGRDDVAAFSSNHPKRGGILEFNDVLARLAAKGVPLKLDDKDPAAGFGVYTKAYAAWVRAAGAGGRPGGVPRPAARSSPEGERRGWTHYTGPVVVSGIAAGVPGTWDRLFRENGVDSIIAGQNLIERLPEEELRKQVEKNLDRVVKSETGAHRFERLQSLDQVMRLAGRAGSFDIAAEFGVRASNSSLMDVTAKLSLAAGLLALKDAGIPMVHHYKRATTGGMIPTAWGLPESLQEGTGVILASAFPGVDSLVDDLTRYFQAKYAGKNAEAAWEIFDRMIGHVREPAERKALMEWYVSQREKARNGDSAAEYRFSRSFLFRALALGHAQAAQFIKAKGPCTQVNAACASTTQAIGIAEDWIRQGRARRVLVIGADDVTNPGLLEWLGTGFLASGAASTGDVVSEAALPFDRRRNGMIIGMGAVGLVLEDGREVAARGMKPLAELLASQFDNSAFHVTRLHARHVSETVERVVAKAEARHGVSRREIAAKTLFMSHETYTPAQGGSSSAEVAALKHVFGEDTRKVIVTNTKGFTGHSMGVSLEDVVAVRALNLGRLPPIANYKEPDPELDGITLSRGGAYDCEYALRLAAGFGSQIALTLMRRGWRVGEPRIVEADRHRTWLRGLSGEAQPELEVVQNTLRIKDSGGARRHGAEAAAAAPATHPAAPRAAAPGAARAGTRSNADALAREVVALVSQKTGYPPDMLELDLDMEADLGIDTVKQAELFAVIRERYSIPRQESLSLKDYPTLRHVVGFVMKGTGAATAAEDAPQTATAENVPAAAPAAPAPASAAPAVSRPGANPAIAREIVALVSQKTGYPPDMLELDLDMEADLGIDTVKQAELFAVIRERYSIPRQESLSLKDYPTLRHVVGFVMKGTGAAPAAPATASAPPAAPAASRAAADPAIAREIVALVSQKTGYPPDMLELDLDMEADLGIDTVKQAELFAVIRERYSIPRQESLSLKDYPTLRHVVGFVMKGTGAAPAAPATASAPPAGAIQAGRNGKGPARRFGPWRLEAYPRPAAVVAPPLRRDRGVVVLCLNAKTAEPFIAAVEKAGGSAVAVETGPWPSGTEAAAVLRRALDGKKAQGIVDVTALDLPDFDAIEPEAFDGWYQKTARALFLTAQTLREDLAEGGPGSVLLLVTRMGGAHGWRAEAPFQALSGALSGLMKALSREFDRAAMRAVDFDAGASLEEMASVALAELGSDDPRREVGYKAGARHAFRLVPHRDPAATKREVTQDSVFLITGGGGALASELCREIVRRHRCRLVLVDLFPLEKEAPEWARLDPEGLKALKDRMWEDLKKDPSRKATPVLLEREFRKVLYSVKVHKDTEEMRRAGSKVLYLAADLTDPAQVARAARAAVEEFGRVDFVLHTAGLEESKLVGDKKVENYDRVVRPKAHGAFNLLKALPPAPGQRWAFFSSVVARFGNIGQTDYATANDFLVKLAARMNAAGRSAVAFDLTAFADVGMATRGGVHDFLESMGVDFMPPAVGLGMLLDELRSGNEPEVVLTGALGKMDSDGLMTVPAPGAGEGALYDTVLEARPGRILLEKTFSLDSDPWLADHSIRGTPYVAGVMGLELFAETAQRCLGAAPAGFEDVRFALPAKLLRGNPLTVHVHLEPGDGDAPQLRLESDFISAKGVRLGDTRVHFTARLLRGAENGEPAPGPGLAEPGEPAVKPETIYSAYFHGPSFRVLSGILTLEEGEIVALFAPPEKPLWPGQVKPLVFSPMLIEAAFQACGYRDLHFAKRMTLPDSIDRVRLWSRGAPPPRMAVRCRYKGADERGRSVYDARVMDSEGRVWVELEGYRAVPVT